MREPLLKLRGDAVEWRAVEGEVVVVDLRDSVYYGVNQTAAVVWPELAAGASRGALVERLVQASGIDSDQAGVEIDAFLESLAELDLLETDG
jgi:Coenzyme PQQ synthesis protein D (PqqD)